MSDTPLPPNPFEDASAKWDALNRDLMLARDEVKHWTGEAAALSADLSKVQADFDKTVADLTDAHAAETDRLNLHIEKLTRERDSYKTFSIQMTVRLRDFGAQALRIVEDAKIATVSDPVVAQYAKPLVPREGAGAQLSPEEEAEVVRIAGMSSVAA